MNFTWAGYVGLISATTICSSERLVIKPTRSGGTVTIMYTVRCPRAGVKGGGGRGSIAIYGLYRYVPL